MQDAGTPGRRFDLPALDGVRALAFLLVFLLHALNGLGTTLPPVERLNPLLAGLLSFGREGVPLFFVLSAFLVTSLLLAEREATGRVDVRAFLVRRSLRLWPLYFALLALFLVVARVRPALAPTPAQIGWYALLCGDLLHMGTPDGPLVFLWSIGVEEKFYVAWSLALALLARGPRPLPDRLARVALARVALALVASAWVFRLASAGSHPWYWLSFGPLGYLDAFGWGILLAARPDLLRRTVAPTAALLALLLALWSAASLGFLIDAGEGAYGFALKMGLVAGACALFVAAVKDARDGWPVWRPLRELGKRSYGAYLFHTLLLGVGGAIARDPRSLAGIAMKPLVLGATVLAAALSYRYFERPFLDLKRRFERVPARPD